MKITKPFVAMMVLQIAQAGQLIVTKQAILTGMNNFIFVFYTNAISSVILLPLAFFIHRSPPPLTFCILAGIFLFGFISCLVQLIGYEAYQYSTASFSSAMLNLIPGFTFILAIIFRMEKADYGSSTTLAKCFGTAVSIMGAFVATLYQGPTLLTPHSDTIPSSQHLLVPETNLILGGSLYTLDCALAAITLIIQTVIVKKYKAELIILFFYCFIIAIVSAVLSLVSGGGQSSWSLQPTTRLIAILYSGLFGAPFQVGIGLWCVAQTGPFFVSMFLPLGIIFAAIVGKVFLGDSFYVGTLAGSIFIVVGFYFVLWGKAREAKMDDNKVVSPSESTEETIPLLQNNV